MFTCTAFTQLCCSSSKGVVCFHVFRLENSAIICQKVLYLCVRIPFRKFCYYSSKGVLCVFVFRLENVAIIRQKVFCVCVCVCVFVCIPFRKFCYYLSKSVVCSRVPRLKGSAVILHKILCVYMCSVYKTMLLFVKVIVSLHVLHLRKLCYYSWEVTVVTCTALTNGSYLSELFMDSCNFLQILRYYFSEGLR
jgi:hypothetical protein